MNGYRLREIRESRGLTQKDLADRVGMSDQQIYRYESDKTDATGEALTKLSKALEVSADYLLGLVDEPNDHLREESLSPVEQRLIWALRHGYIVEAFKTLASGLEGFDQSSIPTIDPTVDGESLQRVK